MSNKIYHLAIIIFYCIWSLWAVMSLSGCNQTSKNSPPANKLINGNVTLLWNEIPGATSYNIYMSKSPGVTKFSGLKIPNVTNPIKINQLEPSKTYYFVVTMVNRSGESKESKELSYTAVENKIGLVYWKDLFDKSIQDHKSNTVKTRQEFKVIAERTKTEAERPPFKNEVLSEKISGNEKSPGDLAKENLQPAPKRVIESAIIKEDLPENSKPATVPIETSSDHNLLVIEEMLLRNAKTFFDSDFYVFFKQNSNELSPKAMKKLDRIHEILTNKSAAKLTLNGYSDSLGISSYNQMVSEFRAFTVKNYLTGRGIKPSRIMAFGHGAQKFIASNKSEKGRRLNRRVEIKIIIP